MSGLLQVLNVVLFWVFAGLLCAWIAPKKGRHPLIWFALGVLFSIFAVGLLLLLPPAAKKKRAVPPLVILPPSEVCNKVWFYLDNRHEQHGPVDFHIIAKRLAEKQLSQQNYIWSEGMESWKKIDEVPEVVKELKPKETISSRSKN